MEGGARHSPQLGVEARYRAAMPLTDSDPVAVVQAVVLALVPMILSLTVHEFAHAQVASWLGDDTPRTQGRLTLDPRAHVDPVGSLLLPGLSVVLGGGAFLGWARPVEFRPDRFRVGVPRSTGAVLVALAGPGANAILAVLSAAALSALARRGALSLPVAMLLRSFVMVNVALALFNLLPVPPLDGFRLLPRSLAALAPGLQRFGLAGVLVVFLLVPQVANAVFYAPLAVVVSALLGAFGVS